MTGAYDRDNRWGVGIEVIQKAGYYNYYQHGDQMISKKHLESTFATKALSFRS